MRLRVFLVASALLTLSWSPTLARSETDPNDRLSFWGSPRRGGNFFNEVESRQRFRAARVAGLEWVRLVPDKWNGAQRDSYGHGSVAGLTHLSPVDDPAILYSFHFYDPWQYTARRANKGRYAYPENMPAHGDAPAEKWGRDELVTTLNDRGWHWAFYSFREDAWDRMDYEIGTGPLGWRYWQAVEQGESPLRPRTDNPLWRVLQDGLRSGR